MDYIRINARKLFCFSVLVLGFQLFPLFIVNVQAQTSSNQNICAQKQCVKIQNGNLWVLSI